MNSTWSMQVRRKMRAKSAVTARARGALHATRVALAQRDTFEFCGFQRIWSGGFALRTKLLFLPLAAALAGCGGNMQGVVQGTGERVVFTYTQGLVSDEYTAVIGDEAFKGKAVMAGGGTTFGSVSGTTYSGANTSFGSGTFLGLTTTGSFVALLLGDKGSTLRCNMQYADSGGFTTAGGVGQCLHSDGRTIDVIW